MTLTIPHDTRIEIYIMISFIETVTTILWSTIDGGIQVQPGTGPVIIGRLPEWLPASTLARQCLQTAADYLLECTSTTP